MDDDKWLWHQRYGHLNFNSLRLLSSKKMVIELPNIQIPKAICEECVMSKQARKSFKSTAFHKAVDSPEIIYLDICGPIEVLIDGFFLSPLKFA